MLLTIDIGNTSIAVGIFNQKDLNATFRIATDRDNFPDEYGSLLLNLLRSANIAVDEITAAVISSTVPGLTTTFQEVCEKYFQVKPVIVGAGIKTGINILYENPKEVITAKKIQQWGAIQFVKLVLGVPVVPGR